MHDYSRSQVSSIVVTDLIPLKQRGLYQGMANMWVTLFFYRKVSLITHRLYGLGAGIGK